MNGNVDIVNGPTQTTLGQNGPDLVVPFPPQSPYPRVDPKDVLESGKKSQEQSQKGGQDLAKGLSSLIGSFNPNQGQQQSTTPPPFPQAQVDPNFNMSSGQKPASGFSMSTGYNPDASPIGSHQAFTMYGPKVDYVDANGVVHGTPDKDSTAGIGHIKGNPFNLNSEASGVPTAMTYARGTEHYGIKPGEWYKSDYDGKMHRWMDTTGAANPDNEDVYYGTGDNSNLPHFAEGGLVTQPTEAVVGEAGPEAIIHLHPDAFPRESSPDEDALPPGEHPIGSITPPVKPEQQLSFVQQFRAKHPEYNTMKDTDLLAKAKDVFAPNMDQGEFEKMARSKLAKQLFKEGEDPSLTPIQRIKKAYKIDMDDEQLLHVLYDAGVKRGKIDPARTDFGAFKDKWMPTSQNGVLQNFLQGSANQMGAGLRDAAGAFWSVPDVTHRLYQQMIDSVGGKGAEAAMEKWTADNLIHPDLKKFLNFIHDYATKGAQTNYYASQKDAEAAARAAGVSGFAGRAVGGAAGQTPTALMTAMFPGASLGVRTALAAAYGEMSQYSRQMQTGGEFTFKDAFLSSAQGAAFGLIVNTPMGRLASGTLQTLMGANPDDIWDWMHKPDDKSKLGKIMSTAASDFLLGVMMRGAPEEVPRTKMLGRYAAGEIQPEVLPKAKPGEPPPPMPEQETGQHWEEGGFDPDKVYPSDVEHELDQAVEARATGDVEKTAKHVNQAVAMMPEAKQKDLGDQVIAAVHDGAEKKAPFTPKEEKPYTKEEALKEAKRREEAGLYAEKEDVKESEAGTLFYSGIHWKPFIDFIENNLAGMRDMVKALAHPLEGTRQKWSALLNPEEYSGGGPEEVTPSRLGGAYLREERVKSEQNVKNPVAALAREMGIKNDVLHGDRGTRREAEFSKFKDSENRDHIHLAETGRVDDIKDPKVKAMMKFYLGAAKMLNGIEESLGIGYKIRDNYIFHALKKEDQDRFFRDLKNRGIDPDFVHPRQFNNVMEMLAAGYELKTWNPERLFQMRLHASTTAIEQISWFNRLRNEGLAWVVGDPSVPKEGFRSATQYRTPDKLSWYLHPDLEPLYKNAFDHSKLYNSIVGTPARFFRALRGTTSALTLAWSLFHPTHLLRIRGAATLSVAMERALHGNGDGADFLRAAVDNLSIGTTRAWKDVKGYERYIQFARNELGMKDLTPGEQEFVNWMNEAGVKLNSSHSDEVRFMEGLTRGAINYVAGVAGKSGAFRGENLIQKAVEADAGLSIGYHFLTGGVEGKKSGNYLGTKWVFGHLIPCLKAADLAAKVNELFEARPELKTTTFAKERALALTKIGKEIEGRYGEMFYNNLFWNKTMKDVGSAGLLSLGWQLSAFRIYGGAVHDLMDNAAHADKVIQTWKAEGARAAAAKVLTSRVLFAANYTMLSALTNGVITATGMMAWNAAHPDQKKDILPTGSDYWFPRIGLNADGSPQRLSTPDFTREIPSIWHHIQQEGLFSGTESLISSKLQPLVSSVVQTTKNTNFYGQQIFSTDPNTPWYQKLGQQVGYILGNSITPIPLKQALEQRSGQPAPFQSAADVTDPKAWQRLGQRVGSVGTILSFLGYSPASQWTQRSDIENEIVQAYGREQGHTRPLESMPKYNALLDYRSAILAKDPEAIKDAYQKAVKEGVTERTLVNAAKTAHIPIAKRLFRQLAPNTQAEILAKMQGQQRQEYEAVASKKGVAAFHERETTTRPTP